MITWYSRLLCHHPYAVLTSVAVVVATCLVISLTARPLPSFTDPSLGFETRGTQIKNREIAWSNLLEGTQRSGPLIVNPAVDSVFLWKLQRNESRKTSEKPVHVHKVCVEKTVTGYREVKENCTLTDNTAAKVARDGSTSASPLEILRQLDEDGNSNGDEVEDYLQYDGYGHEDEGDHSGHDHFGDDGFFCGNLVSEYGRVVIESKFSKDNLFTLTNLKSICEIDASLRSPPEFSSFCDSSHNVCCRSWSIPNYVALLNNRSSCYDITEEDIERTHSLLHRCSRHFDLQLKDGCGPRGCHSVPEACVKYNAVYTILHFLADSEFLSLVTERNSEDILKQPTGATNSVSTTYASLPQKFETDETLKHTTVFLPVARSTKLLSYYKALQDFSISAGNLSVVAMDLGLREALFDELLVSDFYLLLVGGSIIIFIMWSYTGSLFITIITVISIVCSIVIAYFFYIFIFEIPFFPYMNVLSVVIAIGLGADDVFVFCHMWHLAKQDKNSATLSKLVDSAIYHATSSVVITSLTTSAAFYASCTSYITAIKCFSIFAGTVVLANLLLMITWIPASMVIAERWGASWCCICVSPSPVYKSQLAPLCAKICKFPLCVCYFFKEFGRIFFDKLLPWFIIKPKVIWVMLLGCLATCGALAVLYWPRLRLPDSDEFCLFSRDHILEKYNLEFRFKFWFERNLRKDVVNHQPIRIVWGLVPIDNGDHLDPSSKGYLVFDPTFDVSAPESQWWLLNFCRNLRNQSFYMSTIGPLLPNCFIETFKTWMERRCVDPVKNRRPCCEESQFPYTKEVFNKCLHEGIKDLYDTPREYFLPGVAGPKFSKGDGRVAAAVIEYDSTYLWSYSFEEMNTFFKEVESWVSKELQEAPPGMRNGWFISYLSFYDVQQALSYGTRTAVIISVCVCFAVLFLTTLNVWISLLSVFSIAAVIFVTIAALILLGWRLNIMESVTVSIAIGLAVDFTLHYGVAYKLCPENDREMAVTWAASRLGSPVFMAALTSVTAGICMMPARVMAYINIGIFLMILTSVSYVYSTFFYLPLMGIFGPESNCGQLMYPIMKLKSCCKRSEKSHVDKTVYQQAYMSESTLSTSSNNCGPHTTSPNPDSHELEPLTSSHSARKLGLTVPCHGPVKASLVLMNENHFSSERRRHNRKAAEVSPIPDNTIAFHFDRSASLSSSGYKEKRKKGGLRKVSLPSPGGSTWVENAEEPSPRHSVAPTSSATTILYSEPDTDTGSVSLSRGQISNCDSAVFSPSHMSGINSCTKSELPASCCPSSYHCLSESPLSLSPVKCPSFREGMPTRI